MYESGSPNSQLGVSYPLRLIDHEMARTEALAALAAQQKEDDDARESQLIPRSS